MAKYSLADKMIFSSQSLAAKPKNGLHWQLTEEFKWGSSWLQDAKGILIAQIENTQASCQIRFSSVQQIVVLESELKAYLAEGLKIKRAGL